MAGEVLDGNWVDMLTISSGVLGIGAKPLMRRIGKMSPCWIHRDVINDFLNAASFAPFTLLLAAPFNNWVFKELVSASKVSLGLAGGIGVLYVAKEIFSIRP